MFRLDNIIRGVTIGDMDAAHRPSCGLSEAKERFHPSHKVSCLYYRISYVILVLIGLALIPHSAVQAQSKPTGSLLNVSAVPSDDQLVCATFLSGRKSTAWLTRIDGKREFGRMFWSSKLIRKELTIARKASRSSAKPVRNRGKTVKPKTATLKSYRGYLATCQSPSSASAESSQIRFTHVKGILDTKCMTCHASRGMPTTEIGLRQGGFVAAGSLADSPLYTFLRNNPEQFSPASMPQGGVPLSDLHIMMLSRWIRDLSTTTPPPPPAPTAPPGASDFEQGVTLYAAYCGQCHGSIETSTKRGRTAEQILQAIGPNGISQMQHLTLSAEEIVKIALALSGLNSTPTPSPSPTPVAPTRFQKAFAVLQQHCFGCHTGGSFKWETYTTEQDWVAAELVTPGNMQASRLTLRLKHGAQDNPISTGDMPSPKNSTIWNNFTLTDYETIKDWVMNIDPQLPPPDPSVIETEGPIYRGTTDGLRLGDRLFIKGVLLDIFGASASAIVDPLIYLRTGMFGGPCDPRDLYQTYALDGQGRLRAKNYINDCVSVDIEDSRASLTPPSSTLRAGLIEKACLSLSFNGTTLQYAAEGAGGSGATSRWPTTLDIQKVYQSFYPGRVPPTASQQAFAEVVAGAQQKFPASSLEGWRYLFIATCNGGEWQQP